MEKHHFQYINILRGIAISGVLAVHSSANIRGLPQLVQWVCNFGQLGVQLFFLVSAYTLCKSIDSRAENGWAPFFVRRFFRIAPLYYLGIILYALAGGFFYYFENGIFKFDDFYNFTAISENIFFINILDYRYFNNVVPGGWSISTEFIFYLCFPFLLTMRNLVAKKFIQFYFFCFIVFTFFIYKVDSALAKTFIESWPEATRFFGQFQIIVLSFIPFFLGMLCSKAQKIYVNFCWVLIACCLVLLSIFFLNTTKAIPNQSFIYILCASLAYAIFLLKLSSTAANKSLITIFFSKLGEVSYSFYILHFFCLDLIYLILDSSVIQNEELNSIVKFLIVYMATMFLTFGVSWVTFQIIEKPFILTGHKLASRLANKEPQVV